MKKITFINLFDYSPIYHVGDRRLTFEYTDCVPRKKGISYKPIINGKTVNVKNKIIRVLDTDHSKGDIEIITKCEIYSTRGGKLKLAHTL